MALHDEEDEARLALARAERDLVELERFTPRFGTEMRSLLGAYKLTYQDWLDERIPENVRAYRFIYQITRLRFERRLSECLVLAGAPNR